MFKQIYCLVRLDQRLFQSFEGITENELAQAGEGSCGYTEASYGRIILYNEKSQEKREAYLQGGLTFTDRILSNLTTFLEEINGSKGIIERIKHNVLNGLNNRQQLNRDAHDEVGHLGKVNVITCETGFVLER